MKKKLRKKNLIILIAILVILIGGITTSVILLSKDNPTGENNNNDNNDNDNKEEPTVQVVDLESSSRPYAVMINNIGAARPYHTGLGDAYLVYEMVVEGGITRYLALFKDKTNEVVGNVRSARHYYIDYVLENDAYYVHWGWSPQAQSDISSLDIDNLNGLTYSSPYFFRQNISGVSTEHKAFTNLKELGNLVNRLGYRTETNKDLLLRYSATSVELPSDAEDATNIDIKYSGSSTTNYVYDSETKVYKQFVNDKEHTDYETKEQYTVKNIIAYKVGYTTITGDEKGRQDLDNIGSGEGYFITEGKVIPITWEKNSRSSQTVYRDKEGHEITVNDGNTWIHIVPSSGNISIS